MQSLQLLKECNIDPADCSHMPAGCDVCLKAKGTLSNYKGQPSVYNEKVLEMVFSDLVGLIYISAGSSKYFLTFIEAKTRYTLVNKNQRSSV